PCRACENRDCVVQQRACNDLEWRELKGHPHNDARMAKFFRGPAMGRCRGGPPWPPLRWIMCFRGKEGPCRACGCRCCVVQPRACSDLQRRELNGNADHIYGVRRRGGCRRSTNTHRQQKISVSYVSLRKRDCEPHRRAYP